MGDVVPYKYWIRAKLRRSNPYGSWQEETTVDRLRRQGLLPGSATDCLAMPDVEHTEWFDNQVLGIITNSVQTE